MAVFFLKHGAVPSIEKSASNYAAGDSVFLIENGNPIEYLVVNQGNPDPTLYSEGCDGTWVLRKNGYGSSRYQNYGGYMSYANSALKVYVDKTFAATLDTKVISAIKTVTIPDYDAETFSMTSVQCTVFPLSAAEFGHPSFSDGKKLQLFPSSYTADQSRASDSMNWSRTASGGTQDQSLVVYADGSIGYFQAINSRAVRPAMILDFNTKFDPNTNVIL